MPKALKKSHCWKKPRVIVKANYVQVAERKRLSTVIACFITFETLGIFAILITAMCFAGTGDWAGLIVVGLIFVGVPLGATWALYRPPRVLRLFPEEMLGCRYRVFLGIKIKPRWYDLSQSEITIEQHAGRGDEQVTKANMLLSVLLMFTGPAGILISYVLGPKRYEQIPIYCLMHASSTDKPVALFLDRSTAVGLADLYASMDAKVVKT